MSAADIHSILYRGEDPLKAVFQPKNLNKKAVPRYWPGKAPDGVRIESDEEIGGEQLLCADDLIALQAAELKRLKRLRAAKREESKVDPNDKLERRRLLHEAAVIRSSGTNDITILEDKKT